MPVVRVNLDQTDTVVAQKIMIKKEENSIKRPEGVRSCEQTTCGASIAISVSFMSRPRHSLTQLEPKGEDVSIQALSHNPPPSKHKTWGLWQVSALTNPEKRGGVPKMLFQLRDVHQSIQMGTFRGNLGTSDRNG